MIKRILFLLVLVAPGLVLLYFHLNPTADQVYSVPIAHFYVVTFTTFSAAVLSVLLVFSLGTEAVPRHVLAAVAFAAIGGLFFSHGLATPGALISHRHPAVSWSAWLTLLVGGFLFALAGLNGLGWLPKWLTTRRITYISAVFVLVYSSVAAFFPNWLTRLEELANPTLQAAIFYGSLGLWIFAALSLGWVWRQTHSRLDATLVFVSTWLSLATISMHRFTVWHYSWWIYHINLLGAFLVAAFVLITGYEQVRQFRLARYYLALSLILTVLLALAASYLFTQFSYNLLVSEIERSSSRIANNLANDLPKGMSDTATADDLRAHAQEINALLSERLTGLSLEDATVYDDRGIAIAASDPYYVGIRVSDKDSFAMALQGDTLVTVLPPGSQPSGYGSANKSDMIATFAPVLAGGMDSQEGSHNGEPALGVLVTLQEAPELAAATIRARTNGLVTAGVSMGLLFLALLSVVGRADRIITSRTEELRQVSARLHTYSEWLLGRELLRKLLADPNSLGLIRRQRTVLFIDLRGFTRWSENHTPEEVADMLNRYYQEIAKVMNAYNAIKFKFAADEAMAVFAQPFEAIAAARELAIGVDKLLHEHEIGAGIGLHTGQLVEGLLGSLEVRFYDVIGDTVNTAKRIESAAGRCEVLISESTRTASGYSAQFGEPRQIMVKGKEEPLTVYPLRMDC